MSDVIRPRWHRDTFSPKVATSFRYYYSRISSPPFGRFGITAFSTGISPEKEKERASESIGLNYSLLPESSALFRARVSSRLAR